MKVLVTGAGGFIGRNLTARLQTSGGCTVTLFTSENSEFDLRAGLATADVIYHLAGINRSKMIEDFEIGNAGLTRRICEILCELGRAPRIIMSSTIQVAMDNPYGVSKQHAEDILCQFAAQTGAQLRIYRLKNVFGKWCRPNYNSVVATFCHNIANDQPIQMSDPNREIELIYVDDVIESFLSELPGRCPASEDNEIPAVKVTLADLAGRIQCFHDFRTNLLAPEFAIRFNQQLYATYLSYLPEYRRRQQLEAKIDTRGALAEFIKSKSFGQIFVSRTKPGVIRGNHYHHTKTEKFFVVEGEAVIKMRRIDSGEVVEYRVCGDAFQVIDIPPGFTHSIENVGAREMVTLFWANEIFDPDRPDTYFLPVVTPTEKSTLVAP